MPAWLSRLMFLHTYIRVCGIGRVNNGILHVPLLSAAGDQVTGGEL